MSSPSSPKKVPSRFTSSSRSFFLLLVGIAVTPLDHIIGAHIVIVSLIIITHQLLRK